MASFNQINIGTTPNDGTGTTLRDGGQIINNNFEEVNNSFAEKSNVLTKTNTTPFTPANDYEPSTKKYVDDNSAQGGEYQGFYFKWKAAPVNSTPSSGYFSLNNTTPSSTTTIKIHSESQTKHTGNLIGDMKYILIRDVSTGESVQFEITVSNKVGDLYTLTVTSGDANDDLTTISDSIDYNISFISKNGTSVGMTSFYIKDDNNDSYEITNGVTITHNGSDGVSCSSASVSSTEKKITFGLTPNGVNGSVLQDGTIEYPKLNGVGLPQEPRNLIVEPDGTFSLSDTEASHTPYIGNLSISGDGVKKVFQITPPSGAFSPITPVCFLYDYTDNRNVILGKDIGLGSPDVYIESDSANNGFNIVFQTAPASGKNYALTYIC